MPPNARSAPRRWWWIPAATGMIKPQALVPFALTETEAREALTGWLGRLWFAPNGLLEYTRKGRAMNGVYVPYWTFDAQTASRYTGQRGEHYYETRTVTVKVNGTSEQRAGTGAEDPLVSGLGSGGAAASTMCWWWPRTACPPASELRAGRPGI